MSLMLLKVGGGFEFLAMIGCGASATADVLSNWPKWSFFFSTNGMSVSFTIRILPQTGVTMDGFGHNGGMLELFK